MTESVSRELVDAIVSEIAKTIAALPEGSILQSKEAFDIAQRMVTEDVAERGFRMTTAEFNTHARSIHFAAYYPTREIVAKQLRGLTLQDVVETTEKAILRFLGRTELEVVPKPTKAFSGFCEPRDAWNLISNIFHARWAAEKAVLEPEDGLVRDMHKCEQMLHFMCQHDVEPEDIDGKPYDGAIREQTWLPRGSARPVAAIPFP